MKITEANKVHVSHIKIVDDLRLLRVWPTREQFDAMLVPNFDPPPPFPTCSIWRRVGTERLGLKDWQLTGILS